MRAAVLFRTVTAPEHCIVTSHATLLPPSVLSRFRMAYMNNTAFKCWQWGIFLYQYYGFWQL
jgi:hypothetical protein